jgi:CRISPR-associated Csx10 family RAMP protein
MTPRRLSKQVTIHATAPLLLGEKSGMSNFEQTLDFIPGARVRGAVASRALEKCTQPAYKDNHAACPDRQSCPFWQLFGDDDIFFGNAYAGISGPVYPVPLTAHTCKYYAGIPEADSQSARDDAHGVWDTLVERLVHETLVDTQFPHRAEILPELGQRIPKLPAWAHKEICPKCGNAAQPASGYYMPGPPLASAGHVPISRRMHVGINRARFAAEDSLLFTQESLDTRGTNINFFAEVSAPEAKLDLLTQYLNGSHALGRGRSRGYGMVKIDMAGSRSDQDLPMRFARLQVAAEKALRAWLSEDKTANKPEKFSAQFFSLTLTSPAIFETFGRPILVPDAGEIGIPEAFLLRAWTKPVTISGWDVAAGLPRRTRQAAAAGSVFLFAVPAGLDVLPGLALLGENGLGEERARGFGQLQVCAPIHINSLRDFGRS